MEMYVDLDNMRLKQLVRMVQSVAGTVPFPIIEQACMVVDVKMSNVPLFLPLNQPDAEWMQ